MSIAQSTTIQAYQLCKGGARARLAILRMIAANSAHNFNPHTRLQPGDWKAARRYTLAGYAAAYGTFSAGQNQWYSHAGEYFRGERDAREMAGVSCHGWYTGGDCRDIAIGIVARLPHDRFIAGYRWTSNDERVYFPEVFTDEIDAAKMSDEHARVFAESAQEYDARFQAMVDAEIEVDNETMELQESIALRHKARFGGFDRVRDAIEVLRKARETLADATAAYERG